MYRPNPDVVATTFEDDESVLLNLRTRRYYTLNETGTLIWELVAEGASASRIISALTAEYDVSEDEARRHVDMIMSDLRDEGLVEEVKGRTES